MKRLIVVSVLVLSSIAPSFAAKKDPRQIAKVTFKEVIPTDEEIYLAHVDMENAFRAPRANDIGSDLDDASVILDKVVLVGQKVINIIKAGAPVIDVKRDAVHVVPQGVSAWQNLGGWQVPLVKSYALNMKNGFGATVVNVRMKVSGATGGSYDGKGKYISNVYVVPTAISVMWGFNLNVWLENHTPVNTGSLARPVAGLGVDLMYKVSGAIPVTAIQGAQDYFITGDGKLLAL